MISTEGLSREEWLAYRRKGIGGSDAAAVLGISPFRTGVDLYYDKLGQPVEDDEQNWVAKEMGTVLEDLHIKDLNNALDCAHSVGSPVPMTAQVQEILQWMHNHEGGQKDHSAIAQYYEYLTGIQIGR